MPADVTTPRDVKPPRDARTRRDATSRRRQPRRGRLAAAPEGRTWLQRVELPEFAAQALRVLHAAHGEPGAVLEDAQIAQHVLGPTRELLQRSFRRTGGVSAPMRALRLADGFVFDVSGRPAAADTFEGDLFFAMHHSRNLDKDFGALLVASRGVPLSTAAAVPHVADVLEGLYPSWRAIAEAPRTRDAEFPATLQMVHRDGEATREDTFRVSAAAFEQLRRRVGEADGVTRVDAEGLGVRLLHRDGLLVLGLRHPGHEGEELRFEVRPGAFGTAVEHGVAGVYVHGGRSLLRGLLTAHPVTPVAAATAPPHADLTTCDNLVLAVRAMALSTTYPETELFSLLGVRSEEPPGPVSPPAEGISAYALPAEARLAGVCSDVLARTLARRGVPRGETNAATLGAWAVLARRAGGGFRERGVVCLNAEPELEGAQGTLTRGWRDATLARHAAVRVAAACLDWFGRDVSVTHTELDGAHTLVFADENGPFALAGRPFQAARGVPPPPHTALCQRLAAGNAPDDHPVPAAEALAGLAGDAPGAAARRLAVIDTLSASFPQFASAARALRCVWLHSEKRRLAAAGVTGADYCRRMCELAQLSHLPEGPHFWASVPFLPGA